MKTTNRGRHSAVRIRSTKMAKMRNAPPFCSHSPDVPLKLLVILNPKRRPTNIVRWVISQKKTPACYICVRRFGTPCRFHFLSWEYWDGVVIRNVGRQIHHAGYYPKKNSSVLYLCQTFRNTISLPFFELRILGRCCNPKRRSTNTSRWVISQKKLQRVIFVSDVSEHLIASIFWVEENTGTVL